jgi:outer membrane protein assembly factor BamD (BamD/ComL family)
MKYFYLIIFVFFSLKASFSQSKKAFQQDYLLAKMMFEDSNYVESMHAFKTLTIANKNNPFSEYAYYFCGLSAYRAGKNTDARFILLEGEKSNPEWDKNDELFYLLGVVLLEEGDSSRAVLYLNKIEHEEVLEAANGLLDFYEINQVLNEIDDLAALKQELLEHPESLKTAKKLAKNLNKKGNTTEEKKLFRVFDSGLWIRC